MEEFFTADWHLFHRAIIDYCNRPHKDVKSMHKDIIKRINDKVDVSDTLWNIGDIAMLGSSQSLRVGKEMDKINGIKHLVLGNHDEWRPKLYTNIGFSTVHTVMWFDRAGYTFYLAHDPAIYTVIENNTKAVLLCGHIHNLFKHLLPQKRVINVGVDVWDFNPVSLDKILKLLKEYNVGG